MIRCASQSEPRCLRLIVERNIQKYIRLLFRLHGLNSNALQVLRNFFHINIASTCSMSDNHAIYHYSWPIVEERRPDAREAKRPSASDVIKRREVPVTHGVTSNRETTWADIVKGPTKINTNEMKGKGKTVSRLLSRNNPVELNEVFIDLRVRVRVNSSVRRAGRDRVRVRNQDVVETGYAPRSEMSVWYDIYYCLLCLHLGQF